MFETRIRTDGDLPVQGRRPRSARLTPPGAPAQGASPFDALARGLVAIGEWLSGRRIMSRVP